MADQGYLWYDTRRLVGGRFDTECSVEYRKIEQAVAATATKVAVEVGLEISRTWSD